jgi:hypothetical protein
MFYLGKIPFVNMGKKQFFDKVVMGGTRLRLEKNWPVEFRTLLSRCWSEDKNLRPDFKMILTELDEVISEQERLEEVRLRQCSRRWISFLSVCLERSGPFWFLIFLILLLYAMTLVIAQNSLVNGAALSMISIFFLYGMGFYFLQLWHCKGKTLVTNGGMELESEQTSKSGESSGSGGPIKEIERIGDVHEASLRNEYAFNPIVNQMAQRSSINL